MADGQIRRRPQCAMLLRGPETPLNSRLMCDDCKYPQCTTYVGGEKFDEYSIEHNSISSIRKNRIRTLNMDNVKKKRLFIGESSHHNKHAWVVCLHGIGFLAL